MTELQVAKDVLKKIRIEKSGTNNFALIPKKANSVKTIDLHLHCVCLAKLLHNGNLPNIKYFVDNPSLNVVHNYELDYISWLSNDSPFSDVFRIKSTKFISTYGAIYNTNFPPQFVVSAAISLRYVTEFPHIVKFWNKFRKHISPEAALIMAHFFHISSSRMNVGAYGNTNHQWVQENNFGQKQLRRFMDFDFSQMENLSTMSNDQNYSNLTKIWGEDYQKMLKMPLGQKFETPSEWGGMISQRYFSSKTIKTTCHDWVELNYG